MGNLTTALVFVMAINVFLWLGQVATLELNPDAGTFYNRDGTILNQFDKNNGEGDPLLDTENTANQLPAGEGSINPETGNIFTDIFASIKGWVAQSTGISYLIAILAAPYNILKAMHLPAEFAYAMGTFWYAVTLLLFLAFIWGREA